MTAHELIARLSTLPVDREICVDVADLGFIDVVDVTDDPDNPGAAILIADRGDMCDVVRSINADSITSPESPPPCGGDPRCKTHQGGTFDLEGKKECRR